MTRINVRIISRLSSVTEAVPVIHEDVLKSIQNLVDYNWDDEKQDFNMMLEEPGFKPERHIFSDLQRVSGWLKALGHEAKA